MSDNNLKEVWLFAMDQLKNEYKLQGEEKEKEFTLWFNMNYIEDNIDTIKVSVPNQFMWNSMKSKGNVDKVIEKIKEISGLPHIEIIPEIKNEMIFSEKSEEKETENLSEKIKKEEKKQKYDYEQLDSKEIKNNTLNENFTFDNFITGEGSSSNFAYKVALAVAENPGTKTNPILLYGGVGLGKTHLMQAIGNRIYEKYGTSKKICYIQAESFLNEFTNSLLTKTADKFKNKYRKLDVLLIDDIQFLQGKEGIQQELFYVFEALHKNKAQMVFTCDRPLKEIEKMEERLVSRLGSGMSLDLQPPNFETRKAIIYKKLENEGKTLSDDVVDVISKSVETNIRDLIGGSSQTSQIFHNEHIVVNGSITISAFNRYSLLCEIALYIQTHAIHIDNGGKSLFLRCRNSNIDTLSAGRDSQIDIEVCTSSAIARTLSTDHIAGQSCQISTNISKPFTIASNGSGRSNRSSASFNL